MIGLLWVAACLLTAWHLIEVPFDRDRNP